MLLGTLVPGRAEALQSIFRIVLGQFSEISFLGRFGGGVTVAFLQPIRAKEAAKGGPATRIRQQ